jgi:hypothetical protein
MKSEYGAKSKITLSLTLKGSLPSMALNKAHQLVTAAAAELSGGHRRAAGSNSMSSSWQNT